MDIKEYKERLKRYEEANERLSRARKEAKNMEKDFWEYLGQSIISQNYQIANTDTKSYGMLKVVENEVIFYPKLEIPEGFERVEEKFYSDHDEDGDSYDLTHIYILRNREDNICISVIEKADKEKIYYEKNEKKLAEIQKNYYVMDYWIRYTIEINGYKKTLARNFKGEITKALIKEILKGKNICYNDFAKWKNREYFKFNTPYLNIGVIVENEPLLKKDEKQKKLAEIEKYLLNIADSLTSKKITEDIARITVGKTYPYESKNEYKINEGTITITIRVLEKSSIFYSCKDFKIEVDSPLNEIQIMIEKEQDKEKMIVHFSYNEWPQDLDLEKRIPILELIGAEE